MKSLIPFFLKYLLAPLLAMIMVFIMGALKSIRQQLSVKRIIVFSLLAGLFLGLPSLFGFLKNEYVWEGLVLTVISYLVLGFVYLWAFVYGNPCGSTVWRYWNVDLLSCF